MRCPLCNGNFRNFLPVKGRKNSFCPKCGSLERQRLIYLYLKRRTNFFIKNHKVLHVAPHKALYRKFNKLENLNYICINIQPKVSEIKMNLIDLSFENEFFDIIICSHVLEHIADDRLAMRELYRVCSPQGIIVTSMLRICPLTSQYKDTVVRFGQKIMDIIDIHGLNEIIFISRKGD